MLAPVLFVVGIVALLSMAYAGYSAAPWVPTWKKDVLRMLRLAKVKAGEKVVDLGCGDGKILFFAANIFHARAWGVEIGIPQYVHAQVLRLFQPQRKNIHIQLGNLFSFNLRDADVVIVYLLPKCYDRLLKKFEQELKPGTRVIVQAWPFPQWKSVQMDRPTPRDLPLFLYRK